MQQYKSILVFVLVFTSFHVFARESIYSNLHEKSCKTVFIDQETGSSKQICPGISGFKLAVLDADARQTIDVITPDGREHPLAIWSVVTTAFSTVGNKAEWRVKKNDKKKLPFALIVRVNAQENPETPGIYVSYLVVAKISKDVICIVDRIPPGKMQNEIARASADASASKKCMQSI